MESRVGVEPYPKPLILIIKGGFGAYPFLVWALWFWSPLSFWGALYLAFLMEMLPLLGLAQLPLANDDGPFPRIPIYLSSGALILFLGWCGLVIGGWEVGREIMGLDVPFGIPTLFWTLAVTLGIHAILFGFFAGRRLFSIKESALLSQLLPRTWAEKVIFTFLSFAAGIGEELAFRGFCLPSLALVTGSWWGGAVISSVAFALLHAYQGWVGVLRTGTMGFLLAASLIISGSLWPAIIAHTVLDLMSGLVLSDSLLKESR